MTEDSKTQNARQFPQSGKEIVQVTTDRSAQIQNQQKEQSQREIEETLAEFVVRILPPSPTVRNPYDPYEPIKIPEPFPFHSPKSVLDSLNPQSLADKALALSLKMIKQRRQREAVQLKILSQLRNKNQRQPVQLLEGDASRMLDKKNFIHQHRYLREGHYLTLNQAQVRKRRGNQSVVLPKLTLSQQREIIRKEGLLLAKCKTMNSKYEIRKIAAQLLADIIAKSVEIYHRKRGYFKKDPNKKISVLLGQSIVRRRVRKGSLTLSRVVDISISKQLEKVEGSDKEEDQEQKIKQNRQNNVDQDQRSLSSQQQEQKHQHTQKSDDQDEQSESQSQSDKKTSEKASEAESVRQQDSGLSQNEDHMQQSVE